MKKEEKIILSLILLLILGLLIFIIVREIKKKDNKKKSENNSKENNNKNINNSLPYGICNDYDKRPKCSLEPGYSEFAPCCLDADKGFPNSGYGPNKCFMGYSGRYCLDDKSQCSNQGGPCEDDNYNLDNNCVNLCESMF